MNTFTLELDMEQADKLVVQNLEQALEVLEDIYGQYEYMPPNEQVVYTAIQVVLRYYSVVPGVNDVA